MTLPVSLPFLPVLMWTYLTTFVFPSALDPARVSAPWSQLVHHTSDPGIQPLLGALHITMHSGWQLTKGQITTMYRGRMEAGVTSQSQSSP